MGQLLGKPTLNPVIEPFTNLPRKAISHTWQVFNDIADGFGVSKDELEEICADLKDEACISRIAMIEKTEALFLVLDTDSNGLIDALEFLSTLAVLSGMRLNEIIEFVLTSYDFDGTQMLSIDEVTLALRSTASGLCKLCSQKLPREEFIEHLVSTIFSDQVGLEASDSMRLRVSILTFELARHPDIRCWYSYFGSPAQTGLHYHEVSRVEIDHESENAIISRESQLLSAMHWDVRCPPADVEVDSLENPWIASVAMLTPIQYANQTMRRLPPDETIGIEWIHGYQGEKCRNNVHYNFQGDLVYNISKYVIVYNFSKHEQSVFSGHTDEIQCVAMHPSGQYVASGELGPYPSVIVWHTTSRAILFREKTIHRNGIIQLSFSPDGKILCVVGNDRFHTMSVHMWEENSLVFTSLVDKGDCLACTVLMNGCIVVGGDSYIYFWSRSVDRQGFTKRRGNFSRLASVQPITCLAQVGHSDCTVAGTTSGSLFLWIDCNCVKTIKGHEGPVNSLYSCTFGIVSGGRDHRVRLWTHRMEPGVTFDCSNFGILPSIRSVCMSSDGTSILIGTKGGNIYELSGVDGSDLRGGPLANGHYIGKVKCLAAHPSKHEFATVGDDKQLRIVDMNTHSTVKLSCFDAEARAVTYSPLGDLIVVGFGGESSATRSGAFVVLNEVDMSVIHEAHDSTSSITLVLFSPDGETLAVAAEDGAIFLYAVQDEYELIGRCLRHDAPVTQMDFSVDGEWLRSNSKSKDLCFFNADDGSYQSNLASMRDVQWATSTCLYSWHTRAAHKSGFKGEQVVCLHTSSPTSGLFMACGTSYGYIRLHSFPCVPDDSECHRFPAHVDTIIGLRFSFDSARLISVGLNDRCVIQWRRSSYPVEEKNGDFVDLPESEDFALEAREGSDLEQDFMTTSSFVSEGILNASKLSDPIQLQPSPALSVWMDSVVAPVNIPVQNNNIPDLSIRLENAYGFKCQDLRNCVRYSNNDGIVYPCATIGVVMNKTTRAQRFFQKHTDAISAFTCSKDGSLAATGQIGFSPFVAVWETASCSCLKVLPDLQKNAVCCLRFSSSTTLLAVASLDRNHTISIYDWRSELAVSRFFAGSNRILAMCFSHDDINFVTCGIKDIKMWENVLSRTPTSKRPVLGEIGAWQPFLCCESFGSSVVIGTSDGNLYAFEGANLRHAVKAHRTAVSALDSSIDNVLLVSGGKDGAVRVWNQNLDCVKEITVDSVITSISPKVRSVCFSMDISNLLIATQGGEIFEVAVRTGALIAVNSKQQSLVQGHGCRELWGLACHPTKDEFVTTGDDATIRLWDSKNCVLIRSVKVDSASRAVNYSPDGKYLVVGFGFGRRMKGKAASKEGAFVVMNANDFRILHEGKDSNEPIRVIRFSPDSKILAIGSDDAQIYTYNVKDSFGRRATLSCHRAPIVSIDFSVDGQFIFSVDSTRRMCYSEVNSGINIPSPAALRDERWSTFSSNVGWPVQGMWFPQPEGVEPTCTQRSQNGLLVATGNSGGRVIISHFPCPTRAGFVSFAGHAGPISQVSWMAGDGTILTIGRKDHSILQWKCKFDMIRESGDEGGKSCADSVAERDCGHDGSRMDKYLASPTSESISVICPPSDIKDFNDSTPTTNVDLEFVHGVRIADSRNSIRYNEDGNLIFIAATFGVIYDRVTQEQTVYNGHTAAVICIDVDITGNIAVTGDSQEFPEIHIWDARTAKMIVKFGSNHKRGVSSVSFSRSCQFLASLGQDVMNSLVVFKSPSCRWVDGFVLYSISVSPKRMLWVLYAENNEYPVTCGGVGVVYFFRASGLSAEKRRGAFGKKRQIQPILCGVIGEAHSTGEQLIISGTVSGHIYIWQNRRVSQAITAHDSPVYSICKVGNRFASAGKDGFMKIWSSDFKLISNINLQALRPTPENTSCFALRSNNNSTKIVLAMRSGEMYEMSLLTNTSILLVESHCQLELHGIDANPVNSDEIATSGDDGFIRIWSLSLRRCIRRGTVDAASRVLAWSPDGALLIVGIGGNPAQSAKDGAFFVLNSMTMEIVLEERKAKKTLTDIKFSPSGEVIAMASLDGKVYLHNSGNYSLVRTLLPPIKRCLFSKIDFTHDGLYLRHGTSVEDLYYFSTGDGQVISSTTVTRDLIWVSVSCPLTWLTQGISRPALDRVAIKCVALNPARTLLAVSYQDGVVRLYRYPCTSPLTQNFLVIKGISTQCVNLTFSSDGKYLLLLDSLTRIVLQYVLQ